MTTLIRHEIHGHVVQNNEAQKQELNLFKYGFGHYEILNEGFALYQELRVNEVVWQRIYLYYLAVDYALNHNFYETFCYLFQWLDKEFSYYLTARVKRGMSDTSKPGSNLKDKFYLEGLLLLTKYSDKEINLVKNAKFDHKYLKEVKEILEY